MGKFTDLTGKVFGKLTVLERDKEKIGKTAAAYWVCECECGNKKSVRSDRLKNGEVVSCGCVKKERPKDTTSMLGKRFGRLVVVERDLNKPTGHGKDGYWICQCDCGKKISVRTTSLTNGSTKSCGCLRSELRTQKNTLDITGKRYGKLVALENTGEKTNRNCYIWKCQCDCGNICYYPVEVLQLGRTNSCGCGLSSKGELLIEKLLKENDISFIKEFSFSDLRSPITNYKLRYDFAIFKDEKLIKLIEFDGEQHFQEKEGFFKGSLAERQKIDNFKNNFAKEKNIPLVRIPYWEYKNLTIEKIMGDEFLC